MSDFMGLGRSGPYAGKPHERVEIIGPGYVVHIDKAIFGLCGPHGPTIWVLDPFLLFNC